MRCGVHRVSFVQTFFTRFTGGAWFSASVFLRGVAQLLTTLGALCLDGMLSSSECAELGLFFAPEHIIRRDTKVMLVELEYASGRIP